MTNLPLGDQQLELHRFVTERGPVTVREVVDEYGEPRGLARTTVLTMMEKLREKGYFVRRRSGGVYRYSSRVSAEEAEQTLVERFVESTLGGSIAPFVAYLTRVRKLSAQEAEELRRLARELDKGEER